MSLYYDGLTDKDLINYAYTIADKVRENAQVMHQVANNATEQVLLGDFPGAVDDAVIVIGAASAIRRWRWFFARLTNWLNPRILLMIPSPVTRCHLLYDSRESY